MRTIEWDAGTVRMIDQRRLPGELIILNLTDYRDVARAIREMAIRGAPAIGAAAAFALALGARQSTARNRDDLLTELNAVAQTLRQTRPTAVNLFWAIERLLARAQAPELRTTAEIVAALEAEAQSLADEDVVINRRIGEHGAEVISDG
ncbi:MAG: S-methyl-5-thioribose-1-phosphate isomerase, partial [Chloroflexota bacterium]|nr:S-methyl-5-thioribose-1-phosphate isomerase [Chloroflexota bacterium]